MDNNTLAIIISIVGSAGAIVVAIAVTAIVLSRQGSRQDAETSALRAEARADNAALRAESNDRFEALRDEIRAQGDRFENAQRENRDEIRALGHRIENRIGLDERMRTVEQRTAATTPAD